MLRVPRCVEEGREGVKMKRGKFMGISCSFVMFLRKERQGDSARVTSL